ncbi:EAL domain-containing response regulator [Pseudoalteromonas luteoviolacea]|uniref:Diguanylate phosphodiesterase n=1 Tax=Pseudoalteromonas luteoviolacea S4054 TaxID=1129367 RepID=A0A0F6A6A1_9GAMM|nr:EAL domain-containing response regulator [Pseudoalteromonas luteoviolacea]AOT08152.1 hypothetical protein S4054249_09975 [Pseudoalteromonas luteoviolacea]AOT13069.1 hypothetical protein S40542_09975 [Pseudoalteromonas luteoviolacea]AOT17981.1 hypothetical protein S4054_09970 [Pseudoalteromonas luteoviolacea]KKE81648.1 hypothetical protein N479_21745 [Pseudoalteromonas luteoviolacea S4054]KZN69481.1 hypothetical protein N481_22075 [Pseudoalteromonas luteoviolacea S4047-1]
MEQTNSKILIIDDQQVIRFTLGVCLKNIGFTHITSAANGLEAKKCIEQEVFSIIFCDLNMPIADGFEVLRHLGEMSFTGAVIVISDADPDILNSTSNLAKVYNLNIIGCIGKPIEYATVKQLLRGVNIVHTSATNRGNDPISRSQLVGYIESGDLVPFYQPQLDLRAMRISGFEVLARIVTTENKIISPARFIPVAEQSLELVTALTKTIIEAAFKDISINASYFEGLTIAVNISGKVLEEESFPSWLKEQVDKYAIEPELVICELTETALNNDKTKADSQILRLRMLNFKLSIDDFGTGYSSIAQLHSLPFNELKVDQRFIVDCISNPKSAAIVEQSIQMAKAMGLTVVAEGIENKEVEAFVKALGCDIGQGFLYSKPLKLEDVLALESRELERQEKEDT